MTAIFTRFAPRNASAMLAGLSALNRVGTGLIVLAMVILGSLGSILFLDLYTTTAVPQQIPHSRADGSNGASNPRDIRLKTEQEAHQSAGPLIRSPDSPLWIAMAVSQTTIDHRIRAIFDIRLLRSTDFRFWLVPANESTASIEITDAVAQGEGGLYLTVEPQPGAYDIVGEVNTHFRWKPKIKGWQGVDLSTLQQNFTKTGVALYAVFLAFAAFSLCVSLVNRSLLFLVFSAWLIASIRIAGFNYGWDFYWLGLDPGGDVVTPMLMRISLAAYGFLTCCLFISIFKRKLKGSLVQASIQLCLLGFGMLALLGELVTLPTYMNLFWLNALIALSLIGIGVVKVMFSGLTVTVCLYAASYAVMIFGMAAEILYQMNLLTALSGAINAAGGAIVSAIVMSVTLAAEIREERNARLRAQNGEITALKKFEGVYHRTPVGLFSMSKDGSLRSANPVFNKMFEIENANKTSAAFERLWRKGLQSLCEQVLQGQNAGACEINVLAGTDNERWYLVDLAASETGFDGSIADISARKLAESRLAFLATHDSVTGALNQHGLDSALKHCLRNGTQGVFGQFALDHFGYVHKIQGPVIGDQILMRLVQEIANAVPGAQTARVSDHVFLLAEGCDVEGIRLTIDDCFNKLHLAGLKIGTVEMPAAFSGGLCKLEGCENASDALTRASLAYDMALERGGRCVIVAEDHANAVIQQLDSMRVAGGLEEHIRAGRFFLVAQPIIDLTDQNAPISFELLLRMRAENGEVIPPAQFIPAAEKIGLMSKLDRFVFSEAIKLVLSAELPMGEIKHLAINLSGSSLNDTGFLNDFYHLVASSRVDLANFCFEVTESVALNSFEQTKAFLGALKELGAMTAIDDFGAGHSSIHYLSELMPDYLKLDGSLVQGMLTNNVHRSFMSKMVELAHDIDVECIAEFVETRAGHAALIEMGVDYAQGYLYSPPIAIGDIGPFCASWQSLQLIPQTRSEPLAPQASQVEMTHSSQATRAEPLDFTQSP